MSLATSVGSNNAIGLPKTNFNGAARILVFFFYYKNMCILMVIMNGMIEHKEKKHTFFSPINWNQFIK